MAEEQWKSESVDQLSELPRVFREALANQRKGRLAEAMELYKRCLIIKADHFDSAYLLAVSLYQSKKVADSVKYFDLAVSLNPRSLAAQKDRGLVLKELKRFEEALVSFGDAIRIEPDLAELHLNQGIVLRELNMLDGALQSYDRAIELQPDFAAAYSNRGNTLANLGRYDEALRSYRKAVALKPAFVDPQYNCGATLHELKRFDEALACYDKVIALKPDYAEAHNNRGSSLMELKRFDEALASYDKAIALKPDYAEAHDNRGSSLLELTRFDEALASFDRAIAMKPDVAKVYSNRARLLSRLKHRDQALQDFNKAIALGERVDFLLSSRLREKMLMCLWDNVEEEVSELKTLIEAGEKASTPFSLLGIVDSPSLQKRCSEIYVAEKFPKTSGGDQIKSVKGNAEKITIGYYSADFHDHPMLYLMAEVFEKHDKSRFRIVGFSFSPKSNSKMLDRILPFFDAFHDVRAMSDRQIVELSRQEGIDIAIDRKGFTKNARTRLFAAGLAPIQVNYLAYPGTMGADYIDYIIADPVLIPDELRGFYTEKIAYLPNSYQPNDRKRIVSDRIFSRAELGLPETAFVYCCFNQNYKITPDVFALWMRILAQAPDSVLWLLEDSPFVVTNLRLTARKYGIDPERLIFAKRMPLADHLARHRYADLFIDTMPYNAHTTASDALWAGLPLLTRTGQSFASRVAASLLLATGLPELVVQTAEDYEKLALTYYKDREALKALKAKLDMNRNTSPLFDSERYVKNLEQLYIQMIKRQRAGLTPDHINVSDEKN
jgi:predicted O-linked N-acetylglucosamine transferase (SPINDLY family)